MPLAWIRCRSVNRAKKIHKMARNKTERQQFDKEYIENNDLDGNPIPEKQLAKRAVKEKWNPVKDDWIEIEKKQDRSVKVSLLPAKKKMKNSAKAYPVGLKQVENPVESREKQKKPSNRAETIVSMAKLGKN